MYLVPPMDDEPPPDYVTFVALHVSDLRRETTRLVGGDHEAAHLYMDVLADVACHWRRLTWRRRLLGHPHAARDYMTKRLATRTKQWRDDQIYEVDVRVMPPPLAMYRRGGGPTASLALRKADLVPDTHRTGVEATADAAIAWVQAYRRQLWHRAGRLIAGGILLIATMIQFMTSISPDS
ncbi:hypothetical protein Ade02nite_43680 [Paractinoplanes deccanensis]|uniref:Uncharacterized protein n=1 Tax=Paractinoplanes deccanensis TaxID=113561 RepID=A0ABQ3Y6W2_9ACTN|nr:hypothetical protein [Actinoplanes deccanensis]GID75727.1 hypothetical protein Ade02nite_43680 [Actinoplanes deccanensis]